MSAAVDIGRAREAGEDHYELVLSDGELLMVALSSKTDKPTDETDFPYIFRGDEKTPLVFSRRPGLVLLNGKVVCVDLGTKAGSQWMAKQGDAELKTIRTLLLSGDPATDAAPLTRMAGSGITVGFSSNDKTESADPAPAAIAEARAALIAAKPVCLVAGKVIPDEADRDMLAQLSELTHLVMSGREMPDLTKLEKLRFLGLGDKPKSLAPLAELTQLQGLWLKECDKVTDFAPLRKLNRLQMLSIGMAANGTGPANLDFLADMRELRSLDLELGDESKIKSIAPVGKLMNLTELAICPMPPAVKDLSPLTKLKNLKILLVDSGSLNERSEEYDEIRKALPDCQIEGFCVGSAWILMVVPVAVGSGLWWRRRSAAGKAA